MPADLDISSFTRSLKAFQINLDDLFKRRMELVREHNIPRYQEDGGLVFYQIVVDEICKILVFIKENFPDKIDRCELFKSIDDLQYQGEFKKYFFNFFIDRSASLPQNGDPEMCFNSSSLEHNSRGADLCYAEGFATTFYSMLCAVLVRFNKENFSDLDGEEVVSFFSKFNRMTTCSNHEIKIGRLSGARGNYEEIVKRKALQESFGSSKIYYNFSTSLYYNSMDEEFDHKSAIISYYKKYLEERAKAGSDAQLLTFELADLISSSAHLCADGNTRAAILLGWMLAILHNENFPIGIYQNFADEEIAKEAKSWTKNFLSNPATPRLSAESKAFYKQKKEQNLFSTKPRDIALGFLEDVSSSLALQQEEIVFLSTPLVLNDLVCIGKSLQLEKDFVVSNLSELHPYEDFTIVDFTNLLSVIEEHNEELAKEDNSLKRNAKIALYFLRSLEEPKKISSEKLGAINLIREAYNNSDFVDEELGLEYEGLLEAYSQSIEEDFSIKLGEIVEEVQYNEDELREDIPSFSALKRDFQPMVDKSNKKTI